MTEGKGVVLAKVRRGRCEEKETSMARVQGAGERVGEEVKEIAGSQVY